MIVVAQVIVCLTLCIIFRSVSDTFVSGVIYCGLAVAINLAIGFTFARPINSDS